MSHVLLGKTELQPTSLQVLGKGFWLAPCARADEVKHAFSESITNLEPSELPALDRDQPHANSLRNINLAKTTIDAILPELLTQRFWAFRIALELHVVDGNLGSSGS